MKIHRFTPSQIAKALADRQAGQSTTEVCKHLGISQVTFYKWKSKFAGMDATQIAKAHAREYENRLLQRIGLMK